MMGLQYSRMEMELYSISNSNMETLVDNGNKSIVSKYLFLGEAMEEIKEKTGINNYNVEMKMLWNENLGDGFKDFVS